MESTLTDAEAYRRQPLRQNIQRRQHAVPPPHHIVSQQAGYLDLLPYVTHSAPESLYHCQAVDAADNSDETESDAPTYTPLERAGYIRTGFRNPWPSWHKPEVEEYWYGLSWSKSAQSGGLLERSTQEEQESKSEQSALTDSQEPLLSNSREEFQLDEDLQVLQPNFEEKTKGMVQATWLGHATVLLQLPSLVDTEEQRPLRILFDPIFSMRCSPSQLFGPIRSYAPPCTVSSLPEIDLVIISHSHYDHLDYDSIVQLWKAHQEYIRFLVPLGNKEWFLSLGIGIGEERVTELDWWDEAILDRKSASSDMDSTDMLRVICTPAQHGSGRYGIDASRSLWSSWTVEHISHGQTYRIYFGGDTGYQFHSPVPDAKIYPTCPAFAEVAKHIGKPDLSFLPISVGASMNFVKSYDVLGLVPQVDEGLTGANHMTPTDAVRVGRVLRGGQDQQAKSIKGVDIDDDEDRCLGKGTAVAIHWGTFVTGLQEVRESIQDLETACEVQGVHFVRGLDERTNMGLSADQHKSGLTFACLNHGQSIYLAMGGTHDD